MFCTTMYSISNLLVVFPLGEQWRKCYYHHSSRQQAILPLQCKVIYRELQHADDLCWQIGGGRMARWGWFYRQTVTGRKTARLLCVFIWSGGVIELVAARIFSLLLFAEFGLRKLNEYVLSAVWRFALL